MRQARYIDHSPWVLKGKQAKEDRAKAKAKPEQNKTTTSKRTNLKSSTSNASEKQVVCC